MKQETKTQVRYYETVTDDFVESSNQNLQLPDAYQWIHKNWCYRMFSACLFGTAWFLSEFYCRLGLHVRIKNRAVLKKCAKEGCFLYGNHTQMVGDVFLPAHVCTPKRIYVVVSPANLGIPVIGPMLPMLGALPVPEDFHRMKQFWKAISARIAQGKCVVIYPEAHVWPYCTQIRPFDSTSFRFPVENKAPVFSMTTTYQKRRFGKKPAITIYVDGPFYAESSLSAKMQQKSLRDMVYNAMVERSANSTYDYIRYEERKSV